MAGGGEVRGTGEVFGVVLATFQGAFLGFVGPRVVTLGFVRLGLQPMVCSGISRIGPIGLI